MRRIGALNRKINKRFVIDSNCWTAYMGKYMLFCRLRKCERSEHLLDGNNSN